MGWIYGNYGGPNWTGGAVGGGYKVRPIDGTDALFRAHDWAYGAMQAARAAGDDKTSDAIKTMADKQLIIGLDKRQFSIDFPR